MLEILKKKRQEGFTLVELLIVIVIIAILAALVIVTFTGVQARARNTERQTDVSAISKYLEVYYTNQSYYPTQAQMTNSDPNAVRTTLASGGASGFDISALQAPGAASGTNSLGTSATPLVGAYGYVPGPTATCAAAACTSYTLYWNEESGGGSGGGIKTKASAN